ncbi:MAG: hypothetical protein ACTHJ7_06350 [Candidatus Nitrosocosmicus sp.]
MNKDIPFYFFFTLLALSISSYYSHGFNKAFGDGLFMEQLSASLGDRKADLLIKMSPPVVTTALINNQGQKPVVEFRLFNDKDNSSFKSVTYYITIEKNGKQLLSNWFYDDNGDLKLQMEPRNTSEITVSGDLDPILNAYKSQGGGNVVASGPIFSEGGLYHFIVRIVTVDYSTTILPDEQQPVFNGWLSVGASKEKVFDINGKQVPVTILGYYDKINNITYVPKTNAINFTMPFNYNMTRLKAPDNNVYLHQEVDLPKPSVFTATGSYDGFVNGKDVKNYLVVDGSNKTKDVAHFMLTKPIVLQIAGEHKPTSSNSNASSVMNFSIMPSQNGSKAQGTAMNMSAMLMPPASK